MSPVRTRRTGGIFAHPTYLLELFAAHRQGQMTCPTPRSPWPARRPLGRLREARQGPAEARTVATIGACPQEDCAVTRVKELWSAIINTFTIPIGYSPDILSNEVSDAVSYAKEYI